MLLIITSIKLCSEVLVVSISRRKKGVRIGKKKGLLLFVYYIIACPGNLRNLTRKL